VDSALLGCAGGASGAGAGDDPNTTGQRWKPGRASAANGDHVRKKPRTFFRTIQSLRTLSDLIAAGGNTAPGP